MQRLCVWTYLLGAGSRTTPYFGHTGTQSLSHLYSAIFRVPVFSVGISMTLNEENLNLP